MGWRGEAGDVYPGEKHLHVPGLKGRKQADIWSADSRSEGAVSISCPALRLNHLIRGKCKVWLAVYLRLGSQSRRIREERQRFLSVIASWRGNSDGRRIFTATRSIVTHRVSTNSSPNTSRGGNLSNRSAHVRRLRVDLSWPALSSLWFTPFSTEPGLFPLSGDGFTCPGILPMFHLLTV